MFQPDASAAKGENAKSRLVLYGGRFIPNADEVGRRNQSQHTV